MGTSDPPESNPLIRLAARSGLFYGWCIVAVVLLVSMVATGTRMVSGVIVKPLEHEFGWDRAEISLALAIGLLANGLGAPFGGRLLDRFGPRLVVSVSIAGTIVATVGTVLMHSIFELTWWWGLVAGLSSGALGGTLGAVVANRWFVARRGFVTGLLGGGASVGQLIFIPLLMDLTVSIDWRAALVLLAGLLAILLPIALLIIRDLPSSVGLEPYGAADASATDLASATRSTPLSRAIRTGDFWLLAGSYFVCGATTGIVGIHFIPHAIEHGFTEDVAAGTLAVIGALNIVGSLCSGYLTDRYNPRLLLAIYYGLRAASLVLLPAVGNEAGLWLFTLLFGLDYVATLAPTVALTADRFGKASLGMILGWIYFGHQLGSALASWGAGVMRIWFGDYTMAFMAAAAIGFIGAALCPRIAATWKPEEEPAAAPAWSVSVSSAEQR
jgi:MFS family permease